VWGDRGVHLFLSTRQKKEDIPVPPFFFGHSNF
jgi:hypothetical protein